jgi:hypothetical protein
VRLLRWRLLEDQRGTFRLLDSPQQGPHGLHQSARHSPRCAGGHGARRTAPSADGPGLFKAFANAFTTEWNRQQGANAAGQDALRAERQKITQQMERLVDAIADGTPTALVNERLAELEQHHQALDTKLAEAVAPAPRLHPNLAEVYRQKVATLVDALDAENGAAAREIVRGLVDAIVLVPGRPPAG